MVFLRWISLCVYHLLFISKFMINFLLFCFSFTFTMVLDSYLVNQCNYVY